jgi:hypothetical protein
MKNMLKMMHALRLALPAALLAGWPGAYVFGQGYVVTWNNPSTYSLSCGSLLGNQWTVSNQSCVFLSADISTGGQPGDPDFDAVVSVTVNPSGNLEASDRLVISVYNGQALKQRATVSGDTINAKFTVQLSFRVPAVSASRIEIEGNTDNNTEKWRIEDEGISLTFPPAPLPVELALFTGEWKDRTARLSWITRSEVNNDYFTLERSFDGQAFAPVAHIPGKGTTTVMSKYRYEDSFSEDRLVYYRLKQTDFNGTEEYLGKTILLKPTGIRQLLAAVPNPAEARQARLLISECRDLEATLEIRSVRGLLIWSRTLVPSSNLETVGLEAENAPLPQGLYLVSLHAAGETQSLRLLITD